MLDGAVYIAEQCSWHSAVLVFHCRHKAVPLLLVELLHLVRLRGDALLRDEPTELLLLGLRDTATDILEHGRCFLWVLDTNQI